ncbi:MAG: hypothetical protein PHR77_19335 [Kiritimatiellae bacterium]|nr:hypothetical protein [Kiritimatiellia bacterium]MDD5520237.1 hypothetical protein [Kiritimatiellia bacterium]
MSDKTQEDGRNGGRGAGGKGCLPGLLSFLLIVFVVCFFLVSLGLNTKRGKCIVQDWLEKQFSMELSVGSVRIGGVGELVVENIVSKDTDVNGTPVFKVKELKVGLRFDGTYRVSAHKAVLNLTPGKSGGWTPNVFGKLGNLPEKHMGELSKLTGSFRKRLNLHLTDCFISWIGVDGVLLTAVNGLSFDMKPLRLPERDIYFYRLEAYNVLGADNTNLHNIERKWLASDAVDYVAADKLSPQVIVPANGFWEIK